MSTHKDIIKKNQEVTRLQFKVFCAVMKNDESLSTLVTELKQKIDELAAFQIIE